MEPAVKLVLCATLIFGIFSPLLKISQRAGVNASELLLINGFTCMLISLITSQIFKYQTSGFNLQALAIVVPATLILNISFFMVNYSFSLKGGNVSVIYAITPASTLLTVAIGLFFLKESNTVVWYKLMAGVMLILTGVFLAATSIKSN